MLDWLMVISLVLVWKQAYSAASAAQLQWLLYPIVVVLEAFSDLVFEDTGSGEWLDVVHEISIVKACAGGNFLAISLLGYLWRWRSEVLTWQRLLAALLLAWLTVIAANALRILVCVNCEDWLARAVGIPPAQSHQLIGVTVYFACLWLQLSRASKTNASYAAAAAVLIYMAMAIVLPVLRAWVLGLPQPGWLYVFSAAVVPVSVAAVVWLEAIYQCALVKPVGGAKRMFRVRKQRQQEYY